MHREMYDRKCTYYELALLRFVGDSGSSADWEPHPGIGWRCNLLSNVRLNAVEDLFGRLLREHYLLTYIFWQN
jgi:hypothetical protein